MSDEDDLKIFIAGINAFADRSHADKIRLFAWLQHFLRKKDRFTTSDINWCYDKLSYKKTNVSQYLSEMEGKELLKDKRGYYVEGKFSAKCDELYGTHDITINIRRMVKNLADVVPDVAEKDFMNEAMICLRYDAGRAAIIMVWNIAFYHLCSYILKHKLKEFNAAYPNRFPKKWNDAKVKTIRTYDDFAVDLKERDVVDICKTANIVTDAVYKILVEKLGKRNSAAHPSTIHVNQIHAEAFIDELIRNVVFAMPI
ncbi:MAG: hypothetical protein ACREQN_03490 [Candidatus Binataceae bacterium]